MMDYRLALLFVATFTVLALVAKYAGAIRDPLTGRGAIPMLAAIAGVSMLFVLVVRDAEVRRERDQAAEIDPIEYRVLRSWRGADARLDAMVDAAMKDGRIVESEMEPIRSRLRLVQAETTRTELQHAISKDDPA